MSNQGKSKQGFWAHPLMRNGIIPIGILGGLAFSSWILYYSYLLDMPLFFYDGLLGIFACLCLLKKRWPKTAWLQVSANTGILLALLLPLFEGLYVFSVHRARDKAQKHPPKEGIFSYAKAKADPVQFKIFWDRFVKEWWDLSEAVTMPDPLDELPFVLKPGSSGSFFDGTVCINSLGFRDDEFDRDKQGRYRIVTIGESTTMGITLKEEGEPWPNVLEELIGREVAGAREIEVINAGVAVYNLHHNLIRLKRDVLPLKPDMVISYHGYNGFHFMDDTMLHVANFPIQVPPPSFHERPMDLLAQMEYRIRLIAYKKEHFQKELPQETVLRLKEAVLDCYYAKLHQQLIELSRKHQFKLVLLSYNMAVNQSSEHEVVRFYAGGFPDVVYRIQANQLQTYMLEEIAQRHDDVIYVDTSKDLDGAYQKYIDLVHLTQEGKDQLAQNVLQAIRPHLPGSNSD